MRARGASGAVVLLAGVVIVVGQAAAQTFVEHSAEVRFQLDFVVPDAALKKMLPEGWAPVVATAGPAKDCNVRMIFMDRVDITGKDGMPAGSNRMVYLAVPIRKTGTELGGQMIIHGLTADAKDAPGPFGVYQAASTNRMTRSTNAPAGGPIEVEENWEFTAASGEHMSAHVKYERGVARKLGSEVKFFSAAKPDFYQIFKIEQGLDIMRNATVPVKDRVKEFSYKASGGKIAGLFDGSERVVSIDAFHWYNRTVSLP
jgi:hypothetical protein